MSNNERFGLYELASRFKELFTEQSILHDRIQPLYEDLSRLTTIFERLSRSHIRIANSFLNNSDLSPVEREGLLEEIKAGGEVIEESFPEIARKFQEAHEHYSNAPELIDLESLRQEALEIIYQASIGLFTLLREESDQVEWPVPLIHVFNYLEIISTQANAALIESVFSLLDSTDPRTAQLIITFLIDPVPATTEEAVVAREIQMEKGEAITDSIKQVLNGDVQFIGDFEHYFEEGGKHKGSLMTLNAQITESLRHRLQGDPVKLTEVETKLRETSTFQRAAFQMAVLLTLYSRFILHED